MGHMPCHQNTKLHKADLTTICEGSRAGLNLVLGKDFLKVLFKIRSLHYRLCTLVTKVLESI